MKKILIAVLCMVSILTACSSSYDEEYSYLKVTNESSYGISDVSWKDNSISSYIYPPNNKIYYSSEKVDVPGGSDYLYFTREVREGSTMTKLKLRTREIITVSRSSSSSYATTFTLTNSTMVTEVDNESNTEALSTINLFAGLSIKNQSFSDLLNVQWQGVAFASNTKEDSIPIGNIVQKEASEGSVYIYFKLRKSNPISARTKEPITVTKGKITEFTFTDNTLIVDTANPNNTGTLKELLTAVTGLSIKNQSSGDLLNVQWQGVAFASNTKEDSIPIGDIVQKEVPEGSVYIYFKLRKSNPISARTKEPVTVTKGKITEFTFTDNTLIVGTANPDSDRTLKDMASTVVFFDDAEGEIQRYAERKNSSYYAKQEDLPNLPNSPATASSIYYNLPYKGKSIALGGNADCKLRLSVTLARTGKLSFWFANKSYDDTNIGTISIDGTENASWSGSYNWSYQEYPLEAGSHEIVWTKDGLDSSSSGYSYLSLDNILVVYTD
ncbi:MAG: hypothetical protein LBB43_06075 [Spirochaetaceae bacterium]|jgi:hypothetical protein|nr:hypothetical protein [Spirochaetaceae bacterium]